VGGGVKSYSLDSILPDILEGVKRPGSAAAVSGVHVSLVENKNDGCDHEETGQNHGDLREAGETLPLASPHIGLGASAEYSGETALLSLLQEHHAGKGDAEQDVDNTKKGLHVAHLLKIGTNSRQVVILS